MYGKGLGEEVSNSLAVVWRKGAAFSSICMSWLLVGNLFGGWS